MGTPEEIYEKPATAFAAEFLGRTVVFEGKFRRSAAQHGSSYPMEIAFRRASDSTPIVDRWRVGAAHTRPEDIVILPPDDCEPTQIDAMVEQVDYLGDRFEYHLRAAGALLILTAPKKERYAVGAKVRLGFDPARLSQSTRIESPMNVTATTDRSSIARVRVRPIRFAEFSLFTFFALVTGLPLLFLLSGSFNLAHRASRGLRSGELGACL